MTILQINSSLFSDGGESTQLANQYVATRRIADPGLRVIVRDLAKEPVPHLTAERFAAFAAKPGERTAEQQAAVALSDALIDELKRADEVLIALPMYNFGMPSTLKSYFDHVARAGLTFHYTAQGAVGHLTDKRVYVFAARGGFYADTPQDWQTAYLRHFLAFLGMADVEFVYAEGLAIDDKTKAEGIARAREAVERLAGRELLAA